MREIKFRAWDNQNSCWAKESEVQLSIGLEFGINDYWKEENGADKCIRWSFMQYTGLKDKNGVEIYEGDIVNVAEKKTFCKSEQCLKLENDSISSLNKFCPDCGVEMKAEDFVESHKVIFKEGSFCYHRELEDELHTSWPFQVAAIYIQWVEVIGNIHENPELCT